MQSVAIPPCHRIRRSFHQTANFLKRATVPDFQHNDFTLIHGQFRQTCHRRPFLWRFPVGAFKPAERFPLPCQPPPKRTPIVQCPIPKTAHCVMLRLRGRCGALQQRHKRLMQHILRLAMAQPQSAAIKNQFRRFRVVERFAPMLLFTHFHSIDTTPSKFV